MQMSKITYYDNAHEQDNALSKITHYNDATGPLLHNDDAISSKVSPADLNRYNTESNNLFILSIYTLF